MIDKNRLIAISDAIIAVAATVMVLKLNVPDQASLDVVKAQWPTLVAYMISYTQIFLAWHEHHDALINIEKIDHRTFLMNCLWLFFITLVPFVTGVVGKSPDHKYSVLLYLGIMTLQILTLHFECHLLEKINHHEMQDAVIVGRIRNVTYAAIVLSLICVFIRPIAAMAIMIAVSIWSVIQLCLGDRIITKED